MGQIRKRGKYYQIRYYRSGQRIEESTGYTKCEDARDELRKRVGQVSDGVRHRILNYRIPNLDMSNPDGLTSLARHGHAEPNT